MSDEQSEPWMNMTSMGQLAKMLRDICDITPKVQKRLEQYSAEWANHEVDDPKVSARIEAARQRAQEGISFLRSKFAHWDEVACRSIPGHAIGGFSPKEWIHQVMVSASRVRELICGDGNTARRGIALDYDENQSVTQAVAFLNDRRIEAEAYAKIVHAAEAQGSEAKTLQSACDATIPSVPGGLTAGDTRKGVAKNGIRKTGVRGDFPKFVEGTANIGPSDVGEWQLLERSLTKKDLAESLGETQKTIESRLNSNGYRQDSRQRFRIRIDNGMTFEDTVALRNYIKKKARKDNSK